VCVCVCARALIGASLFGHIRPVGDPLSTLHNPPLRLLGVCPAPEGACAGAHGVRVHVCVRLLACCDCREDRCTMLVYTLKAGGSAVSGNAIRTRMRACMHALTHSHMSDSPRTLPYMPAPPQISPWVTLTSVQAEGCCSPAGASMRCPVQTHGLRRALTSLNPTLTEPAA